MRIISCGFKKVDYSTEAQNLYIGSLFVTAKKWALMSPDGKWGILSAKHGLLMPTDIVEPYNVTFKKAPHEWTSKVIAQLPPDILLEIAAPKRYIETLLSNPNIVDVLYGLKGMGYQMQWFKQHTTIRNPLFNF